MTDSSAHPAPTAGLDASPGHSSVWACPPCRRLFDAAAGASAAAAGSLPLSSPSPAPSPAPSVPPSSAASPAPPLCSGCGGRLVEYAWGGSPPGAAAPALPAGADPPAPIAAPPPPPPPPACAPEAAPAATLAPAPGDPATAATLIGTAPLILPQAFALPPSSAPESGAAETLRPAPLATPNTVLAAPIQAAPDARRRAAESETLRLPPAPPSSPGPADGSGGSGGDVGPAAAGAEAGVRFGRYRIGSELGRGGMGVVYKAWDEELKRVVAVKMLLAEDAAADPEVIERFLREARSAARLRHPNIVQVYDVGVCAGRHYFTMDFIEGANLESARGSLETRRFVELLRDVARALHVAHEAGVVHRDIKPANLLLDRAGRVYISDFGLAKEVGGRDPHGTTRSGTVLGTPHYMSPEQAGARATQIGPRSDVWSLGVMLYEQLAGGKPFDGEALVDILRAILERDPVPPSRAPAAVARGRRVHADLETISLKCLEKDPGRRYESAGALAEDLDRFLRGEAILARPPGAVRTAWLALRRRPIRSAAAATFLATLCTVGVVYLATPGRLQLTVAPADARVLVDGRPLPAAAAGPRELVLGAGVYELAVESVGYEPESRTVVVERGKSRELSLSLRHYRGALDAEAEPAAAEISFEGKAYGSRLQGFPVDTGSYRLVGRAPEHFDRAVRIDVRRGETARAFLWLERGIVWADHAPEKSQGSFAVQLLTDLNGDGVPEVLSQEGSVLVVLDGRTGSRIRTLPSECSGGVHPLVLDLGGTVGSVVVIGAQDRDRMRATCIDPRGTGDAAKLWVWEGPPGAWPQPASAPVLRLGDRTGDGVAEIALGGRDGAVWILDGKTGAAVARHAVPCNFFRWLVQDPGEPDCVRFIGQAAPREAVGWIETGEVRVGVLRLSTGVLEWSTGLGALVGFNGPGAWFGADTKLYAWTANELRMVEAASGRTLWSRPVDAGWNVAGTQVMSDLTGVGVVAALVPRTDGKVDLVSGADGRTVWSARVRTGSGKYRRDGSVIGIGTRLYVPNEEGLTALDGKTGAVLWSTPGAFNCLLVRDLDGDGRDDFIAGLQGEGVACFDEQGNRAWTLRMEHDVYPVGCPKGPDDGRLGILLRGDAGFVGLARPPRTLWERKAAGGLLATPAAADLDGDGRPEVVQLGAWGQSRSLACLDGATGGFRWFREETLANNRGPGLADLDGDGQPEVLQAGQDRVGGDYFFWAWRGADGAEARRWPLEKGQVYSVPLARDLNRDGVPDPVIHRWGLQDVLALDGRRAGERLWSFPTGAVALGAVGLADLDLDGIPDVVAPFMDGYVYAVGGTDGKLLWKRAIGRGGSRSPPGLEDLNGDGVPEVLVVNRAGTLVVLEGRTGAVLWSAGGGSEAWGRPAVLRGKDGGAILVAPLGAAGVAAFDYASKRVLWQGPKGKAVMASPVVCDLDTDGRMEVVAATMDGEVVVLDAGDGRRLWSFRVAGEVGESASSSGSPTGSAGGAGSAGGKAADAARLSAFEADPVVVDLDGDGVLDILVANHAGRLHAESGRAILGARR
ncbi:MAG: protein kinase [Planctomycetes bacterium]|nr:protein kinase [Planctomycetota bacterium]